MLVRPDGCHLHVVHRGDRSRPALLLLEGMGGDLPGWRRNIPALAEHCWVMAYDHRGNGLSDEPPGPCTMATFVEDAVAVLDDAGVREAVWYGQSFGGMVALEAALSVPGRVRGLILAATHAGRDHAIPVRTTVPKGEPWRALYAPGFPDMHPEHVAEDLRAGASQPPHPTGQRRQWEAIEGWSAFDRLGDVRAPTLVLHGSEDVMIDPGNAHELAAHIEGAELVLVEGAGHVYHSERPEAADAAVLDFIGRLP